MFTALFILLSGFALVPYAALPSEPVECQMFAEAYHPPTTTPVKIQDFTFGPGVVLITTGTTVRWTNNDGVPHTVTSDSGLFDQIKRRLVEHHLAPVFDHNTHAYITNSSRQRKFDHAPSLLFITSHRADNLVSI